MHTHEFLMARQSEPNAGCKLMLFHVNFFTFIFRSMESLSRALGAENFDSYLLSLHSSDVSYVLISFHAVESFITIISCYYININEQKIYCHDLHWDEPLFIPWYWKNSKKYVVVQVDVVGILDHSDDYIWHLIRKPQLSYIGLDCRDGQTRSFKEWAVNKASPLLD
jgi:hypothetical protein